MPVESLKVGRRTARIIRRILVASLAAVLLAAALIYGLADRIPSDYAEALTRAARPPYEQRRDFWRLLGDFSEDGSVGKPFTYRVTADEVNLCLASMDKIASYRYTKPVYPSAKLERAGFADPTVAMDDGVLTLMVRSTEYRKVISVDLAFVFDEQGHIRMEILAVRVGALPVPKALLEKTLRRFRKKLWDMLGRVNNAGLARFGMVPAKDVARFLRVVVGMLDGEAIRPKVVWKDGAAKHPLLIKKVRITDGELTLHFEPIRR